MAKGIVQSRSYGRESLDQDRPAELSALWHEARDSRVEFPERLNDRERLEIPILLVYD